MKKRHCHQWKNREISYVRRNYRNTRQSAEDISRYLSTPTDSVSFRAVKHQAYKLGLSRVERRPWSPEEDERLEDLIQKFPPKTVAKRLKRTETAVLIRCIRLKMSRKIRDGWFTASDVSEILGVSPQWVVSRILSGAILARPHYGQSDKKRSSMWHIDAKDLVDFIRKYPTELQGYPVDMVAFVDLLSSPS